MPWQYATRCLTDVLREGIRISVLVKFDVICLVGVRLSIIEQLLIHFQSGSLNQLRYGFFVLYNYE